MIDFVIDNIFVMFGKRVVHQTVGIHMGTNCVPLLADLFFYSYQATEKYILHIDGKFTM
jgi:hypothetical protein